MTTIGDLEFHVTGKTKKKTMYRLPVYTHRLSFDVLSKGFLVTCWSGTMAELPKCVCAAETVLVDTIAAFRASLHNLQPDLSRRIHLTRSYGNVALLEFLDSSNLCKAFDRDKI